MPMAASIQSRSVAWIVLLLLVVKFVYAGTNKSSLESSFKKCLTCYKDIQELSVLDSGYNCRC